MTHCPSLSLITAYTNKTLQQNPVTPPHKQRKYKHTLTGNAYLYSLKLPPCSCTHISPVRLRAAGVIPQDTDSSCSKMSVLHGNELSASSAKSLFFFVCVCECAHVCFPSTVPKTSLWIAASLWFVYFCSKRMAQQCARNRNEHIALKGSLCDALWEDAVFKSDRTMWNGFCAARTIIQTDTPSAHTLPKWKAHCSNKSWNSTETQTNYATAAIRHKSRE